MQFIDHYDRVEFNNRMLEVEDRLIAMKNICHARLGLLDIYAKQLPSETDRLQGKMRDTILELDELIGQMTRNMQETLPFLTSEID